MVRRRAWPPERCSFRALHALWVNRAASSLRRGKGKGRGAEGVGPAHREQGDGELFRVLEGFPDLAHDDKVDACTAPWNCSTPKCKAEGYYEWLSVTAQARKEQPDHRRPRPFGPRLGRMAGEQKE